MPEHLLPSTRIRAAVYVGRTTKDIARRAGLNEADAHMFACCAARLTSVISPEMAIDIINARIKSLEHRNV